MQKTAIILDMSFKINREEALALYAYAILAKQDIQEREDMLQDAFRSPEEVEMFERILDFFDPVYNDVLVSYIKEVNRGITNTYLSNFTGAMLSASVLVEGDADELYACSCCGYRTLTEPSEYFICKVCFWEDDGTSMADDYSSVNRMTLREAKSNFENRGTKYASPKNWEPNPDRFLMYAKE